MTRCFSVPFAATHFTATHFDATRCAALPLSQNDSGNLRDRLPALLCRSALCGKLHCTSTRCVEPCDSDSALNQDAGRVSMLCGSVLCTSVLLIAPPLSLATRPSHCRQWVGRVSMRDIAVHCSALHCPALRCKSAHCGEPCDSPISLVEANWRVTVPCSAVRCSAVP